ncbi:MAG: C25 family cysteine peptidase [Crocinitomicaceae bacterium]|nr:hypothetical protein [Crocinitomicaceae bacterium]
MKKLLVIASLFCSIFSIGQYANDWINYSQKFYSFKIWQDGVYKIDHSTLTAAGVPVSTIPSDNYQLFGFEKQQKIWIEDGGDGTIDAGDYILFYARKNTTWLDSLMYEDPSMVSNKYYPHYNDTICYFLSWSTIGGNERIIEETDVSFSSYTAQPYFLKTSYKTYHTTYLMGYHIGGMSKSTYEEAEGWYGGLFSSTTGSGIVDSWIPSAMPYTGAGAPTVKGETATAGNSNATNTGFGNHHFQLQYGNSNITLHDTTFSAYKRIFQTFEFPASALSGTQTKIRHIGVNDLGVATDNMAISYVELTYPHLPALENSNYLEFIVPYNTVEAKSRYDLSNFISTNPLAFTIDGDIRKLPVVNNSGTFQVLFPNNTSGDNRKVVVLDETAVQSVSTLEPVNGNGSFTDYSAISYDDAYLIVTGKVLQSSAQQYKSYRESVAGGGHYVILLDAEELALQFGGGVPKHPFGIRRFVHYAYDQATVKPNHLFLLGKGIREANESVSAPYGVRQNGTSYNDNIVPCLGMPASDIYLTAHLSGNLREPLVPTGRLAAKSDQEVLIYLNKVIEFEANQDPNSVYDVPSKLWQKQILHFGGGSTASEQYQFKSYLTQYENIMEGPSFGGNVTSFYKTVSDPIDPVTLYEVTDYINNGVSIMTFFGHASADGFDQNVDDPHNWSNAGKYPLVVGNACLTGNIYEPTDYSTSEEYLLIADKGAIAFISSVKESFSTSLYEYSNALFKEIGVYNYGGSIGESVQRTVDTLDGSVVHGFGKENVMNQMTLHGDPALRINPHEKPELEINTSSIFVKPDNVDLSVDSIDVNVVLYNLGTSATDTFALELVRTFPNGGGDSLYTKIIHGIDYVDTIVFTIPLYNNVGIGINEFCATVDIPSFVDEQYDEVNNNRVCKQVIFDVDGIYPVWPYEYAVIPNDTVTLKGSTINPFADAAVYRFEIDTTDLFDSPFRKQYTQTSLGGIVEVEYNEWLNVNSGLNDPLLLEDSMVYFWRVSSVDTGYYWIESSFQYIPGKSGWGQDHFFQFKNNDFLFLHYDRPSRKRLFGPAFRTIDCDVFGNATSWLETAFTLYHIDGEIAEYNFCTLTPQLLVAVVDPITLKPWGTYYDNGVTILNPTHDFGNANNNGACRSRVEYHFSFWQNNPTQMDAFDNMIANEIPDGHYVLIYTARYGNFVGWDQDNYNTFASLGVDSATLAQNGDVPFILFTKKGNAGGLAQTVKNGGTNFVQGSDINADISQVDTLWGFDYYGAETSPVIGPSAEWYTLYWRLDSMEAPTGDSTRLLLYGIDWAGGKTLIMDTLVDPYDSIINLNNYMDAGQYPYAQLNAQQYDETGFTPSQIDRWHILYADVPEAALDGSAGVYWVPGDSLYEGQDIAVAFDVKNISDLPMDSLLVHYWIEDANHNLQPIQYPRQDSLRVGQTIRDTLTLSSNNLQGLNSIWVEINPYVTAFETDQLEKYHFNNLGQIPFRVVNDDENPILDVTFNGYHILNRDIVDPRSEVIITLKDDNPFLVMDSEDDTANFGIYLTSPDGMQKRLNFRNSVGEPLMEWVPADASNRKFKIIYQGNFEQEGIYRLLVQGADKSGNKSGDFEYDIEFEVDLHSSITNLMNYPNPFTTSTRFVFTLTGAVIPDEFTIQIMNVSGTVVREITLNELGDIKIGRNITEFEWDGTDEFGDRLARGVYLYRAIVKINGDDIDHRESGADKYFVKSFGKMYLL